jgi:hypothetical protein
MTTLQEALDGAIKYINSYAFANWQPVVMALHEAKAALAQQGEQQQVVKEVVVHADYRAMWQEVTRQNQQLCAALSAAPASQAQPDWLLKTTQDLANGIRRRCYPEVPQFEVLDDLSGVISQIDNMTTGMERKAAPQAQPATSDEWLANCPQEVRDFANKLKAVPQPAQDVPETNFGNTPATFAKWLQREMPAGTVIGDPAWWAPRIYNAGDKPPQVGLD